MMNLKRRDLIFPDYVVENLWDEFEDVLFIEEENSDDSCHLVLASDWDNGIHSFPEGTTRDDIWHWFDTHHSKGVGWLLNEYEPEETQE